jgi:hypothetical protein
MDQDETPNSSSEKKLISEINQKSVMDSLARERSGWTWLTKISDVKIRRAGAVAYAMFVDLPIKEAIALASAGVSTESTVREPFTSAHSPEGVLVKRILDEGREVVAFFVYIFLSQKRREVTAGQPEISAALSDVRYEYERHTASALVNSFHDTTLLTLNGGRDSIYVAASEFQKEINNLRSESIHQLAGLKDLAVDAKKQFRVDYNGTRRSLARRKLVWRSIVRRAVEEAKGNIEAATLQLEAARDALGAQIDLKASVEYWKDRKASHESSRKKSLGAVFASMASTLGVMFCYFWLLPSFATTDSKTGEAAAGKAVPIAAAISAQDITNMVTHLFGAALLLTFMGIMVRMALRQYNTHSNCALEAQERITFTKTYLALMHEGKLSADLDRKLVLESLFRPNSFTSSSEITFSTPIDFFMKAAERVK